MADVRPFTADGRDPEMLHDEIQRPFKKMLAELSDESTVDARLTREYAKLLDALSASQANERDWIAKCRDLHGDIQEKASALAYSEKLADEDSSTIADLKRKLDTVAAQISAAQAKEEAALQKGEKDRLRCDDLDAELERHRELLGEDGSIESLLAERNILQSKHQEAVDATDAERLRVEELNAEIAVRRVKLKQRREELRAAKRKVAAAASDALRDAKKAATLEEELARLTAQLGSHDNTIVHLRDRLNAAEERAAALDRQLATQRSANLDSAQELKGAANALAKLQDQLTDARAKLENETEAKQAAQRDLRVAAAELSAEKSRAIGIAAARDAEQREKSRLRTLLDTSQFEATKFKAQVAALQKELESDSAAIKERERAIHRREAEKTVLSRKLVAEAQKAAEGRVELQERVAEVTTLEAERQRDSLELLRLRSDVGVMERDRQRLKAQAEAAAAETGEVREECRMLEQQLAELERREEEAHRRVKEGQAAYEAMRGEKNAVAKQLMDSRDALGELSRKTKVQGNQIDKLKDESHAKDRALVGEQFERRGAEKKLEARSHEVEALKRLIEDAHAAAGRQGSEIDALQATIRRLDAEALVQKRAYDALVTERDLLSAQLLRRNDELALLYTKVDTQCALVTAGESKYRDALEEVRMLTTAVADLKRRLELATAANTSTQVLKTEAARLQRDLLSEQTKVKALSDELETPLNIHRWRRLEGTDPSAYELALKAQTLQKRLIAKTEEAVEAQSRAADAESALAAIKEQLARQPGNEWTEQFTQLHHLLNERTRQVKALASEANMSQSLLAERKFESDRLAKELHAVKTQLFELKERLRASGQTALLLASPKPTDSCVTPALSPYCVTPATSVTAQQSQQQQQDSADINRRPSSSASSTRSASTTGRIRCNSGFTSQHSATAAAPAGAAPTDHAQGPLNLGLVGRRASTSQSGPAVLPTS